MKSCPVCKRTFDELMTFCLVDGSILSAPFEPQVAESRLEPSRSEPETQLLSEPPSPPPTRAIPTSSNEQPPEMVAAEFLLPLTAEFSSPRAPAPILPQPPSMKTIIAPPPEIAFTDRGSTSALVAEDPPSSGRWRFIIGALALCGIAAVGAGWIILRNRTHDNPSTPATALRPENNSKNAAPNTAPITGSTFNEKIDDTEIVLVSIPAGSFLMGSPDSDPQRDPDEGPQNTVTVPNFYMSKFEITQAEYRAVMRDNPARFKGDQLPVESVSWSDANEFCKKLSAQTGRTYRLPTEAEWEYAARAGATSSPVNSLTSLGWCGANSEQRTHPVGEKQANAFGLYDVYGNVWEWCQSEYRGYPYQSGDGRESLNNSVVHVLRGGSWEASNRACRPTYRRRVVPQPSTSGFRVVLTP